MFLLRVVGNGIPTNGIDSCGFRLSSDSESANLNLELHQVSSRHQVVSRACLPFFSLYFASDSGIDNYRQIYLGPVCWNKNQPGQSTRITTKTYVQLNVYLYATRLSLDSPRLAGWRGDAERTDGKLVFYSILLYLFDPEEVLVRVRN
jgi:hypothetical protein